MTAQPIEGPVTLRSQGRSRGPAYVMPDTSFAALGVPAALRSALDRQGIDAPFPIQAAVLPDALAGLDILGRGRTGSGKTRAFGSPLVELVDADDEQPSVLVLVPTRELAVQVTEELALLGAPKGLRAAAAYGGAPVGPQAKRLQGAHLVVESQGTAVRADAHDRVRPVDGPLAVLTFDAPPLNLFDAAMIAALQAAFARP